MVRNSELPEIGKTSKEIAVAVRQLIESHALSQVEVGAIIGRVQSYASLRVKGLKSWTIEELDALAPHLGFSDFFDLMRHVHADHADRENAQWVADHAAEFETAAKTIDWRTEQEAYEDLP